MRRELLSIHHTHKVQTGSSPPPSKQLSGSRTGKGSASGTCSAISLMGYIRKPPLWGQRCPNVLQLLYQGAHQDLHQNLLGCIAGAAEWEQQPLFIFQLAFFLPFWLVGSCLSDKTHRWVCLLWKYAQEAPARDIGLLAPISMGCPWCSSEVWRMVMRVYGSSTRVCLGGFKQPSFVLGGRFALPHLLWLPSRRAATRWPSAQCGR